MENNQTFGKFKSKLTFEAVLNSVLSGLSVGLFVGGLISLICWLSGYKDGIWVALGVGAGVAVIALSLFYILKFRPSVMQTGRRVDSIGLQERAVTMLENMENQSYMANRQRIDATSHIVATSSKALKATVPVWQAIVFSCATVFFVPFGVVSGLYHSEIIASPTAPVDPMTIPIEVTYLVEEGGEINGETDQLILPGEDATTVTAIALDGYMFVGWDDGNKNPSRTDLKITDDLEVTAMFEYIDGDNDGEEGDFEGPGNSGDSASDQPADGSESSGGKGDEGDGQGGAGDSEGTGSGDQEGEGKGDGQGEGAGGKWSEGNQIVNGEIYYRDWLEQYYMEAMQEVSSIDDLPPEVREFIESYFESV